MRAVRGSMGRRLLGKVVAQRITTIDLQGKEIGAKGAAAAVAATLLWSAPTLTSLDLR